MAKQGAQEERWGSRLGVILAVSGSAVGLGNFLRFPGLAAANGGGAFMIPYFIALLLLGIPIGWAEWTMGRYGGEKGFHSAPAIMGVFGKGSIARYLGVVGLLIPLVVYMYYGIIESWCLRYAWEYLSGGMQLGANPVARSHEFFTLVSGQTSNGAFTGDALNTLIFWLVVFALNIWFVWRGLSGGIEKFCQIAMPLMAVCALVVLVRVLTLGTPNPAHPGWNVAHGLGFMWNPKFSKLSDFKTWLAASGQVFFTLSVGFGVIINYASYMRKKDDVVLSGLTAAATNELFEVSFGGLITITAAFVFLGASATTSASGSSFDLGFKSLPVVFHSMGPFGRWIGFVWFFMLFLAAITSSLSMIQPVTAFFSEAIGISRGRAVAIVGLLAGAGSFWVIYFSKGLSALSTMDFWVGTFGIFIMASVMIICFGWVFGIDRGFEEAHEGSHIRIPKIFKFIMKYVAPTYLIAVFAGFCVNNLMGKIHEIGANHIELWTLIFIFVVAALLVAATWMGAKRWRAAGMDLDGKLPAGDEEVRS